jgi:hypothetical protein
MAATLATATRAACELGVLDLRGWKAGPPEFGRCLLRITTYNGAKITTYRNIKQAMRDRRREKELPPGDDGVWYWHLCNNRGNGPFITKAHCNLLGGQSTLPGM